MAEYTIDKIEYGGNVYKLQDNESGFVTTQVFYGTCETAAGTAAKVVTCANFTSSDLKAGVIIVVNFSATNSAAVGNLTLNINNTGAKKIQYINNGIRTNLLDAGYLKASVSYPFIYDGTYWLAQFNYNTTYSAMTAAEAQAGTATTGRIISPLRLKEAIQLHAPDEKVNVTALTSGTMYYPILATGTGTATRQIDSTLNGLRYESISGTTSTAGSASLILGNDIAEGTINNEDGQLVLYGPSGKYGMIVCNSTANRIVELPDQTGTLATTKDIYESVSLTQAEYDALSSTDKADEKKIYYITDSNTDSSIEEMLNTFYPVGSYYETTDPDFDPNLDWGGYWTSETLADNKIVEEGVSGIWTYRKWSSGLAECWGYKTTTGTFAAWATNCYSHTIPAEAYPSNLFNSSPICIANARSTSADTVCGPSASGGGNASHTPTIALIRPTNATGTLTFQAWYHATGTWKTYDSPYPIYKWTRLN